MLKMNKIKPMIYQKDRKIELLHKGEYKGYNYYILNLGTHPTAYIEIPKEHKLYGKHYDDIYEMGYDINVHGGLTYSDSKLMCVKSKNWFIGWDYAHAYDYCGYYELGDFLNEKTKKWTTEEIIEECKSAINQIIEIEGKDEISNKS